MNKKLQRWVTILSTTAALITAIVGVLNVVVGALPSHNEDEEDGN